MKNNYIKKLDDISLRGFSVLLYFCMFYMSIMLFSAIFTDRYIGYDAIFVLGGSFTSPLFFIISDIVAEIYGSKITHRMIFAGFLFQTLFSIFCQFVIRSPSPNLSKFNIYFFIVFNPLLTINLKSFFAYIISSLINVRIITRWKILTQGKNFWIRSLGSSTISEALYSLIAIITMEIFSLSMSHVIKIVLASYSIKLIFSAIISKPAEKLVDFLKIYTKIDISEEDKFTPKFNLK